MSDLTQLLARRIIDTVGANGVPPAYGYQYFTVGLDVYLTVLEDEYFASHLKDGGSAFKMLVGIYGGGKTHFLYGVRDLAWRHNFVVSYVRLSPGESPFHKLELVYKAIVEGLIPPSTPEELLAGTEQGIASFIKSWYSRSQKDLEGKGLTGSTLREELLSEPKQFDEFRSISFRNAVEEAFKALVLNKTTQFDEICQWLKLEGFDRHTLKKYRITQRIDRSTAFTMIRSAAQWVRQIGFSGLVVLLDEGERVPSLTTNQKELHLNNLRELIDECSDPSFQSIMILYAVPDENFLEGRAMVYEALKQRVATVFEDINPTGVKLDLEKIVKEPIDFLLEVGKKLADIYQVAYAHKFDSSQLADLVQLVAKTAHQQKFMDIGYKRLFVQKMVRGLHFLKQRNIVPSASELA